MTAITNLSRYRKQQARAEKRRQGNENAARFGQNKAAKAAGADAMARASSHLDAHRRAGADPAPCRDGADD